jgi:D-aminopeptidase
MSRARDLGIRIGSLEPGEWNAITDVPGVLVGHTTLVSGSGKLVIGEGPVRTGVTVILPHARPWTAPVYAGCFRLNGAGELTGLEWIREAGVLGTPIGLTNTSSVGVVRDAFVAIEARERPSGSLYWVLPVVGETWDGRLNDINGFHVRAEHVVAAYESAASGPVPEGNVGGGTGMVCHGFKGGIGTSSRRVADEAGGYAVGVLVQANHGKRERLTIDGVPVGALIPASEVPIPEDPPVAGVPADTGAAAVNASTASAGPAAGEGAGSIIVVVATDAPLLPNQGDRLAKRASFGIARTGGVGGHFSGDLVVAFSTANQRPPDGLPAPLTTSVETLSDLHITALFEAVIEATEEAIVNALVAAKTMTGIDGATAHAIPHDRLTEIMRKWRPG